MAYLNHICLTFPQDKCDNRFVSHLGHLMAGQIWHQICLRFVFEANIIKFNFSSSDTDQSLRFQRRGYLLVRVRSVSENFISSPGGGEGSVKKKKHKKIDLCILRPLLGLVNVVSAPLHTKNSVLSWRHVQLLSYVNVFFCCNTFA